MLVGRNGIIEGLGNMQRRTETSLSDAGAPWKAWGTKYGSKVEYSAYGVIDAGRRVCHLAGQG